MCEQANMFTYALKTKFFKVTDFVFVARMLSFKKQRKVFNFKYVFQSLISKEINRCSKYFIFTEKIISLIKLQRILVVCVEDAPFACLKNKSLMQGFFPSNKDIFVTILQRRFFFDFKAFNFLSVYVYVHMLWSWHYFILNLITIHKFLTLIILHYITLIFVLS